MSEPLTSHSNCQEHTDRGNFVLGAISLHPIEAFVETSDVGCGGSSQCDGAAFHKNEAAEVTLLISGWQDDPEAFSYSIRFFLIKVEGPKL
jgi:hypothetical protein